MRQVLAQADQFLQAELLRRLCARRARGSTGWRVSTGTPAASCWRAEAASGGTAPGTPGSTMIASRCSLMQDNCPSCVSLQKQRKCPGRAYASLPAQRLNGRPIRVVVKKEGLAALLSGIQGALGCARCK